MVFRYEQTFTAVTTSEISYDAITAHFGSEQAALDDFLSQVTPVIGDSVIQGYADQNVAVTVISSNLEKVWFDAAKKRRNIATLIATFHVVIETEADLQKSPIAPLVIIAIGLAIALIVAAYVGVPLFFDWLKSMSTDTIQSDKYAWVQNPDTGVWEWKLVSSETHTEPSIGGIASIGIILIVLVAVFLLFMVGIPSFRKK